MARFIGIDTSCYTTSVAIFDSQEGIVTEERLLLCVKEGHRGLAQSEMVYQHVRNIPYLFDKIKNEMHSIQGIGVSAFPRRRADSYMPAFLVGKGAAEILTMAYHVPIFYFSHQENHALAAMINAPHLWLQPFYMMHLSGGTQDILSVTWQQNVMNISELMTSIDITAGQLIDRVGVKLGLPFPAGKHLEQLAKNSTFPCIFPVAKIKNAFSFSGVETSIQNTILKQEAAPADIAKGVLVCIAEALKKQLLAYRFEKSRTLIAIGGVMANTYLRNVITEICKEKGLNLLLADIQYSSDNATGNAFGAYMQLKNSNIHIERD